MLPTSTHAAWCIEHVDDGEQGFCTTVRHGYGWTATLTTGSASGLPEVYLDTDDDCLLSPRLAEDLATTLRLLAAMARDEGVDKPAGKTITVVRGEGVVKPAEKTITVVRGEGSTSLRDALDRQAPARPTTTTTTTKDRTMSKLVEAFINSCESTAEWREQRAAEYEDERVASWARRLRELADWARTDPTAAPLIESILPADLDADTGFLILAEEAANVFSRSDIGYASTEAWLRRVREIEDADDAGVTLGDLANEFGCQVYELAAFLDLGADYDPTAELTWGQVLKYRAFWAAGQSATPAE